LKIKVCEGHQDKVIEVVDLFELKKKTKVDREKKISEKSNSGETWVEALEATKLVGRF
jgi:hypothetical protein